jgi:S-adenosylmethionine:tRNA ribosyltransferase-isomerase
LKTSDFDYDLPLEFIAQSPAEPRDAARLLVLDRQTGFVQHKTFHDLGDHLQAGDVLVINQTRVIPARLYGRKVPGGGRVELLLLVKKDAHTWEALVGGKGLSTGRQIIVDSSLRAEIQAVLDGPLRIVRFEQPIEPYLPHIGHVPLPPYITAPLADPEQYQTVFAQEVGSAAAPTAGLHFTRRMMAELAAGGVRFATVTLHIGLDTFAPVTEETPLEHQIHSEWCQLTAEAAETINATWQAGGRVVAVGTTAVRTLETAALHAAPGDLVGVFTGETDLYILPGYTFKAVDTLVTNFHLPKSTLIMLVSAFAGRKRILATYELAKREGYRFYSFGDAMLIE